VYLPTVGGHLHAPPQEGESGKEEA